MSGMAALWPDTAPSQQSYLVSICSPDEQKNKVLSELHLLGGRGSAQWYSMPWALVTTCCCLSLWRIMVPTSDKLMQAVLNDAAEHMVSGMLADAKVSHFFTSTPQLHVAIPTHCGFDTAQWGRSRTDWLSTSALRQHPITCHLVLRQEVACRAAFHER